MGVADLLRRLDKASTAEEHLQCRCEQLEAFLDGEDDLWIWPSPEVMADPTIMADPHVIPAKPPPPMSPGLDLSTLERPVTVGMFKVNEVRPWRPKGDE